MEEITIQIRDFCTRITKNSLLQLIIMWLNHTTQFFQRWIK